MKPTSRNRSPEAGQAIIEFAFIMVPFFLLFLLVVDGGLFFYSYVTATNSVREGARCAVVGGSDANVIARVENELPGDGGTAAVSFRGTSVGDDVTVEATWTYDWLTPVELFGIGGTITRTKTSTMRLETTAADRPCG